MKNGEITSWTSIAVAALGSTNTGAVDKAGDAIVLAGTVGAETLNYVSPWLQLAETYVRNDGELKPADWANAVTGTITNAINNTGGLSDNKQLGYRLLTNALVGGALAQTDKLAAESYFANAIGNEIGTLMGREISASFNKPTVLIRGVSEQEAARIAYEREGDALFAAIDKEFARTTDNGLTSVGIGNEKPEPTMFASLNDGTMTDAGPQNGPLQIAPATNTQLVDENGIPYTQAQIDAAIRAGFADAQVNNGNFTITDDLAGLGIGEESNLELGANERYRESIMLAAERTGLPPETIAAVINAEAATYSGSRLTSTTDEEFYAVHPELNGRALTSSPEDAELISEWKGIKSDLSQIWDPQSQAPGSSARGLTQFTKTTWEAEATRAGTQLNQKARDLGYIGKNNEVIPSQRDNLLKLRNKPELSIMAAAEMGRRNLDSLIKSVDAVSASSSPLNQARALYITHHEGLTGAKRYYNNTYTKIQAETNLNAQFGKKVDGIYVPDTKKINSMIKQQGSAANAYRNWLDNYTNRHIDTSRFIK